jgi:hypothetical protein
MDRQLGREGAEMSEKKETGGKVWRPAPAQSAPMHSGTLHGVWVHPDNEVEWIWTHTPGGSFISGYTIKAPSIPVPKEEEP